MKTPPSESLSIPLQEVRQSCVQAGCPLPEDAYLLLCEYLALLMRWNTSMNLVGAHHWQEALENLLMDSFHLAHFLETLSLPEDLRTWDLGAGAGLPGIPLRMVWHAGQYTLVEVREKRALFLSTVTARLGLPRTNVFRGRVETFFLKERRPAAMVVSRAFMPWRKVLDLVKPVVAAQAVVIFLAREPLPAQDALPIGWQQSAITAYVVGGDTRYFWALRRVATDEPKAG